MPRPRQRADILTCAALFIKARPRIALLIAWLLVVATPVTHAQAALDASDFLHESPIPRGALLTVRYRGAIPLSELELELRQPDGAIIQSTEGFRYQNQAGEAHWIAMIGIPSTLAPGDYPLAIRVAGFLFAKEIASPITVAERSFAQETIPLDARLTAIRADPDPLKIEQARKYIAVINSVTAAAIFFEDEFISPTDRQRITSQFGDRRVYRYSDGTDARGVHNGIDYAAPTGEAVFAVGAGQVRMAEHRITTGNTVILEHLPGVMTVYFHLDSMSVRVNEIVEQGRQIGTVGATGLATGAHLHWELRAGGVAVDPAPYFEQQLLDTIP